MVFAAKQQDKHAWGAPGGIAVLHQAIVVTTHSIAGLDVRVNTDIAVAQVLMAAAGMVSLAWAPCSDIVAHPHITVGTEQISVEMAVRLNLVYVVFQLLHLLGSRPRVGAPLC